jgi:superfamily II RNA helicase
LLLLSATVGNSVEFVNWLYRSHRRKVELVQSSQRKVPLVYRWVGDELLTEQLELMARGDEASRLTPALLFCFNREECWTVAEQLKGKSMIDARQQAALAGELKQYDLSQGAGPKLKQILQRGVGVHHAGVLPKYRRIVEDLFQRKLLSVCVCTETLSAGINLPARSVALPTIMKGPPDKKRIIEPSSAHQILGRPPPVRFTRICLCSRARGRRQTGALAGEIRPDSRGHKRPRAPQGQEGPEEENASAPRRRSVLDRDAV